MTEGARYFLGIDPGKGGGVAVLEDGGRVVVVTPMPGTDRDVFEVIRGAAQLGYPCHAMIEFVSVMPKQGIVSAFTFGQGYGALQMALTACEIPFERVTPPKWQKFMGCQTRGDKNVSKRKAQELFPAVKVTHAIADALLIAEYNRRNKTF